MRRMSTWTEANWSYLVFCVFFAFCIAFCAATGAGLSVCALFAGWWLVAVVEFAGAAVLVFYGCYMIKLTIEKMRVPVRVELRGGGSRGPDESGLMGAGKPVPIRPSPTHHLVAMKDLPPGNRTHSLPRD